jgi:hypothetical protein
VTPAQIREAEKNLEFMESMINAMYPGTSTKMPNEHLGAVLEKI